MFDFHKPRRIFKVHLDYFLFGKEVMSQKLCIVGK